MMSKRLISNRPSDIKPLKQLFWENAEKARMGDYWKDKKSYRELSEATGIPSGSLRMLFMNKPKGNIPKIVTITNGLAKVTKKNITLGMLLSQDNQHEVFEFPRKPDQVTQNLWNNIRKKLHITEAMDAEEVRERMTHFVVSSGMAQTNYNLIKQRGTVSLDTLEKFSKTLRVEPYELLATIRRKENVDKIALPIHRENDIESHIDIGKLNTFIKLQPYSPSGPEAASVDLSPQNLYRYYSKGSAGDMSIKTAYKFKRLVDIYEAENGSLDSSSRVLDAKKLEKLLYSGMTTGYAISKTGLMNATNGNLYIKGKRPIESMKLDRAFGLYKHLKRLKKNQ